MPSGILFADALPVGVDTTLFEGPPGTYTTCTVSLANAGTSAAAVQIRAVTATTPAAGRFVEPRANLVAGGAFERTGIIVGPGQKIVAQPSVAGVDAVVWGTD